MPFFLVVSQGKIGSDDWVWQKQLRFYMETTEAGKKICRARMCVRRQLYKCTNFMYKCEHFTKTGSGQT